MELKIFDFSSNFG